jgi:hypothetical protein
MSATVTKRVELSEQSAQRLVELAKARGATENSLVEEGLALLFRDHDRRTARDVALREDYEELARLEAELGPTSMSTAIPIQWNGAHVIADTPVQLEQLRRIEDVR